MKNMYEIHLQDTKSGEEQTALIKIEDIQEELAYFQNLTHEQSRHNKARASYLSSHLCYATL